MHTCIVFGYIELRNVHDLLGRELFTIFSNSCAPLRVESPTIMFSVVAISNRQNKSSPQSSLAACSKDRLENSTSNVGSKLGKV